MPQQLLLTVLPLEFQKLLAWSPKLRRQRGRRAVLTLLELLEVLHVLLMQRRA